MKPHHILLSEVLMELKGWLEKLEKNQAIRNVKNKIFDAKPMIWRRFYDDTIAQNDMRP